MQEIDVREYCEPLGSGYTDTNIKVFDGARGYTGLRLVASGDPVLDFPELTAQEAIDKQARQIFSDPIRHQRDQAARFAEIGWDVHEVVIEVAGEQTEMTFDEFEAKYRSSRTQRFVARYIAVGFTLGVLLELGLGAL